MVTELTTLLFLITLSPKTCAFYYLDPSLLNPLPPSDVSRVHFLAAGDMMLHSQVLKAAYRSEEDTYDFTPLLKDIKRPVSTADISAVNLETTIGREGGPFSGYPMFVSPPAVIDALKTTGFDIVVTANNHCMDGGYEGLVNTLHHIEKAGLIPCGTYEKGEDSGEILYVERKGIRIAHLAFTYGTNGIPLPRENPHAVLFIDPDEIDRRLKKAKGTSDFVILQLHWGTEYSSTPDATQKSLAEKFLKSGADLLIGCHPHVVQPLAIRESSEGLKCIVYSLGNLLSAQKMDGTDFGIMFEVDLYKDLMTGRTWMTNPQPRPVWVHNYMSNGRDIFEVRDLIDGEVKTLTGAERKRVSQILEQVRGLVHYQKSMDSRPLDAAGPSK